MRRTILVLLGVLAVTLVGVGASAGATGSGSDAAGSGSDDPGSTPVSGALYLALGDSLAAGYQPIGRPEDDHRTQEGYVDQLWLMARQWYPGLELVNLGCPGASTISMREVDPRCPYPHGSQLAEALALIAEHRDELAFITIDVGFNDFPCSDGIECLLPGIAGIRERLPGILAELRAAAPGTPIVGMTIYDPFLTFWLEGNEPLAQISVGAIRLINDALEEVYADAGIPAADVESAFAVTDFETTEPLAGYGGVPRNVARLCLWTWQCFRPPLGPDRHPNVLGFRAMAEAFAEVLRPTWMSVAQGW